MRKINNYSEIASRPKSNINDIKTDVLQIVPRAEFALCDQPLTYVITVHIRNIRASNCSEYLMVRHIANLECTYGADAVESIVRDVFPNFYKQYYMESK